MSSIAFSLAFSLCPLSVQSNDKMQKLCHHWSELFIFQAVFIMLGGTVFGTFPAICILTKHEQTNQNRTFVPYWASIIKTSGLILAKIPREEKKNSHWLVENNYSLKSYKFNSSISWTNCRSEIFVCDFRFCLISPPPITLVNLSNLRDVYMKSR